MIKLKDDPKGLTFNFASMLTGVDGYGYSAEELVKSMIHDHRATIDYFPLMQLNLDHSDPEFLRLVQKAGDLNAKDTLLTYYAPFGFDTMGERFNGKCHIGGTMFETTEIPDWWAEVTETHTDALIVPTEFCKEVFAKKISKPIKVAPLGVDTQLYKHVERPPSPVFTFLMAGQLGIRKGADVAIKAFQEEFGSTEPVRMILKTRTNVLDTLDATISDDRITVVDGDYSRPQMLDFYEAGDCFLAPSRGEGAGLTPREAMATGLPVIATNWSGLTEIMDTKYGWSLDYDIVPVPTRFRHFLGGLDRGQDLGNWAEPSVAHLRKLMREAYEDQETTAAKGEAAANWIKESWTYKHCAAKWLKAVEELYDIV